MLLKIVRKIVEPHALNSGFGLVTMFALTGVIASLALVQQGVNIFPTAMF
ncbi:hypothetical protein [Bradyrhizobium sp. STM 3809]|nr:hypothetical protein [Bradyrhizobium sp. STM 3809]CCE01861.1 conserved exported hypothetical protein [Bradyrhizobium sp. STM 3809]